MNLEFPLVHYCRQLVSFLGVLFIHNPAACRRMTPVSNSAGLTRWLQAQPRRLLSSAPVGSSQWTLLFPASLSICASKSGHRFLYNLGTRSSALSAAPRSRFCPITVSVSFPIHYPIAPTTPCESIRSFRRSGTGRPFRPICSSPSADFQSRCVHVFLIYPATNTQCCRLVAAPKPKCRERPYWTFARPPSTCSG